jgi:RNA recognition motif-containing protein
MKIYVGNLPFAITEDDLRQLFEAYGAVSSTAIVTDKFSGKSRGFGFVEMSDASGAQAAISALNGKDYKGRALTVNEARSQESRGGGGGGRDRGDRGDRRGPR